MESLSSIFNGANAQLEKFNFYFNDLLGGALLTILCLSTVRLIIRALAASWLGKRNGSIVSSITEALTTLLIIGTAYRNPSVVVTALVWGAALFRQFIVYFRGG